MLKNKKSIEMSMAIIVAAVISLIILVVLVTILGGGIGDFSSTLKKSQSCNEVCKLNDYSEGTSAANKPSTEHIRIGSGDKDGEECYCKPK